MGKRYYRIISIAPSGSDRLIKRTHFDKNGNWISINYSQKEKITNNELYTGQLPESLETIELSRYIYNCRKNNKFPTISDFFKMGFAFDGGKGNFLGYTDALIEIKFTKSHNNYRDYFYLNGFYFKGVKYIRYKRSSSSARNGKCLFIMEELYLKHMQKWSDCGLSISNINDLTSWEAYRGLTLSSIEDTIRLPYDSILILKDQETPIPNDVIKPFSEEQENNNKILTNTLWDGEGLLDESVFLSTKRYSADNTSMLFLRERFFKTCAFRTKLQKWFHDNNITNVKELNGFTFAKRPEDIKLVITETSLKYCKFINKDSSEEKFLETSLTSWIKGHGINLSADYKQKSKDLFLGIAKTNHPTKYYNGKLVRTSYQLLNTLPLSKEDIKQLVQPSLEYLNLAKESPLFFRDFIKCGSTGINNIDPIPETNEADIQADICDEEQTTQFKSYYLNELLMQTNTISGTKLYKDYRKAILNNFRTQLIKGRILVEGTLATLFGNPAEFLYCTLKCNKNHILGAPLKYGETISNVLQNNEVYCTHFRDSETIACARNPHITMGNNLIVKNNTSIKFYQDYFSLSDEIVCVNAINTNIQQTLNGADYDSDTMLMTNNPIIVKNAQKAVSVFKTPVNVLDSSPKSLDPDKDIALQISEIDTVIFDNQIGQIINLSQELNSLIWDSVKDHEEDQKYNNLKMDFEDKYNEVAKLAILSNVSLDRAKRIYKIDVKDALHEIISNERKYRYNAIYSVLEERPEYLTKLLGLKSNDQISDIIDLYTWIYNTPGRDISVQNKRRVQSPTSKIKKHFGSNIEMYEYDIINIKTKEILNTFRTINYSSTHDCPMGNLYEIINKKEFEKSLNYTSKNYVLQNGIANSSPKKLTDLIKTPTPYTPAKKYAEKIKGIVKEAFNSQRKIANDKEFSKEEKYMQRNIILNKCFFDVNDYLSKYHSHVDYLIYLLLKSIDDNTLLTQEDKDNKIVGYPSLLLSCICNHTYKKNYVFYDLIHQKSIEDKSVPQKHLQIDPNGNISIYGILHSIINNQTKEDCVE